MIARAFWLPTVLIAVSAPVARGQVDNPAVGDRAATFVAATPEFRFHSDVWLNLHDYLYGIAGGGPDERGGFEPEAKECFASLPAEDAPGWAAADTFYRETMGARHHRRDPLMQSIRHAIAGIAEPDAEATAVLALLSDAAPAYRRCLWAAHDARNRARIAELVGLLVRYGPDLRTELSRLYREPWPESGVLDVVSYSDFGGANTSSEDHTTMSSTNSSTAGFSGLELALHEASHRMFGPTQGAIAEEIARASGSIGGEPPDQLWHALSFYTSGELVARVARAQGEPGFEPYARRHALFGTAFRGYLEPIERHWRPYMEGEVELPEAVSKLVAEVDAGGE